MHLRMRLYTKREIEEMQEDRILFSEITTPVITPYGHTYDKTSITKCINEYLKQEQDPFDPLCRGILFAHELLPNRLFTEIIYDLKQHDPIMLMYHLKDPLSGDIFCHPFVADDGETYEFANLSRYLQTHNNVLPTGSLQENNLDPNRYKNLFVATIIQDERIQKLIHSQTTTNANNNVMYEIYQNSLDEYLDIRTSEGKYAGSAWGYPRETKVRAAYLAKHILAGKVNPLTLFQPRLQQEHNALLQGRLEDMGGRDSYETIKILS